MMEATIKINGIHDVTISDADVVNPDAFIPHGEYNPHNVRPWVALDHGFVVGVAFASCEQNALDELADARKLDQYLLTPCRLDDYGPEEEGVTRLGNASEPFDIESMWLEELQPPAFSFCAMLAASQEGTCSVEGCGRPVEGKGWTACLNHAAAAQWKREGKL